MEKEKVIEFLKELGMEMKNQDTDSQAAPRFWTVGDYKMVDCPEGSQDTYFIVIPDRDYCDDVNSLLAELKGEIEEDFSKEAIEEFFEIEDEIDALEWVKKYCDEDAYIVPVREEHIVHPNTLFLTKAEAKKHIESNYYHYSDKAHTYAMTAWRSPKVEKLLNVLENTDWDAF